MCENSQLHFTFSYKLNKFCYFFQISLRSDDVVSPVLCSIIGFFVSKQPSTLNEKSHRTVISNKNLKASLMNNLTDADKSSSLFSEPLNVNFELGDEVWDDYDDGSLVHASSFTADMKKMKNSGNCI